MNILDFGAKRRAFCGDAIQRAIDAAAAQGGGRVSVPGGQGVFDLFLALGYDAFHLSRAESVMLPDGVPVFSACWDWYRACPIWCSCCLLLRC